MAQYYSRYTHWSEVCKTLDNLQLVGYYRHKRKALHNVHRKVVKTIMNTKSTNKQGFTIIEVVLVLAIAALIFLMVFIALPALQRNQRDTARKNDASTVAAAVQSFVSNERKSITSADAGTLRNYVDKLDQYDKANIQVAANTTTNPTLEGSSAAETVSTIVVTPKAKCSGSSNAAGNARSATVRIKMESGTGIYHCIDV